MKRDWPVIAWLGAVCSLIVLIVLIGGVTRLTHSGLSIVDWKPLMGAIPPLNERDWSVVFERYQSSPEYRLRNAAMTLEGFKDIFFWEYLHRLVARLIGLVVLVPGLVFLLRRRLRRGLALKIAFGFMLGGLQGFLGWFMVKSGLAAVPYVSHYRLAAHLGLALVVLAYYFWLLLDLLYDGRSEVLEVIEADRRVARFRGALWLMGALIFLQIVYGALTAGLKAGFAYNTFPRMNGLWLPPALWLEELGARNPFENGAAVQFIHRLIAWVLVAFAVLAFLSARKVPLTQRSRRGVLALGLTVACQFLLGVATLVYRVPIVLAVAHQVGACVVLLAFLNLAQSLRSAREVRHEV